MAWRLNEFLSGAQGLLLGRPSCRYPRRDIRDLADCCIGYLVVVSGAGNTLSRCSEPRHPLVVIGSLTVPTVPR